MNCFMFPETFDPLEHCFPSRPRPARSGRGLQILMAVLDRHPDARSDLMQSLAAEGASGDLFHPTEHDQN